jgi:hypothetical protein
MLVALQFVGAAVVPLNVTVLVPCVLPKFAPLIVTEIPTDPEVGFTLVIAGAEVPVPASDIAIGTALALFVMLRLPTREPVAVGEKTTFATQLFPGVKGEDATQLSVSEKSPLVLRPNMLRFAVAALVSVNC